MKGSWRKRNVCNRTVQPFRLWFLFLDVKVRGNETQYQLHNRQTEQISNYEAKESHQILEPLQDGVGDDGLVYDQIHIIVKQINHMMNTRARFKMYLFCSDSLGLQTPVGLFRNANNGEELFSCWRPNKVACQQGPTFKMKIWCTMKTLHSRYPKTQIRRTNALHVDIE